MSTYILYNIIMWSVCSQCDRIDQDVRVDFGVHTHTHTHIRVCIQGDSSIENIVTPDLNYKFAREITKLLVV